MMVSHDSEIHRTLGYEGERNIMANKGIMLGRSHRVKTFFGKIIEERNLVQASWYSDNFAAMSNGKIEDRENKNQQNILNEIKGIFVSWGLHTQVPQTE